jgi:hypothetical protein
MTERRVDHSALRTNQAFIITLLALAFVLDVPALVAFVGVVMIVGTIWPEAGLFKRIYRHLLRPAGIVRPDVIVDNPEPHLFAQGLGGVVLTVGFVAFLAGLEIVGWALAGVVIVLAGLNLFAGWCAGCTIYYWLNRLGVPGFSRTRIEVSQ